MPRKLRNKFHRIRIGKALGYCRVSTAEQRDHGVSLECQAAAIRTEAARRGLVASIYVDGGVSGSIPLGARPAGAKLLEDMQPGDVVVAAKMDRLFRSVQDACNVNADLEDRQVGLVLLDKATDTTTPEGRLTFHLFASVGEFERARTRARIIEARALMRSQSRYMGGSTPFAHRIEVRDGRRRVVPDEKVLSEVKRLKALGYSTRLVSGHLKANGIEASHNAIAKLFRDLK